MDLKEIKKEAKKPRIYLGNFYRNVVTSFIILTLVLILVILYFSLNKAVVTIIPNKESINTDFIANVKEVESDEQITEEDTVKGIILEKEEVVMQTFEATGTKIIEGDSDIVGEVTIINNHSKNQPLVKTTRLLTPDDILFRINEGVTVPAGGEVKVEIYADDPSQLEGKIVEPTKMTIPGLWEGLQDDIYAQSDENITAQGKETTVVSENDFERAKLRLAEKSAKQAIKDVETDLVAGYKILSVVNDQEIIKEDNSVEIGEQVEEFNLKMKTEVVIVSFDKERLQDLAEAKLREILPDDKTLSRVNSESLTYSLETYDVENKTATIKVSCEGTIVLSEKSSILDKEKLSGLNKEEVEAYLNNFQAIKDVKVEFWPFWLNSIPRLKDHVEIVIKK